MLKNSFRVGHWIVLIVVLSCFGYAQNSAPSSTGAEGSRASNPELEKLQVMVGKSQILDFVDVIERVSVANPDIADALPITPKQVMINAKTNGITTLTLWTKTGTRLSYELAVQIDTAPLSARLKELFPTEQIHVSSVKDSIVLSGPVSSPVVVTKAAEVAQLFSKNIVNLMNVPASEMKDEPQILLQVRFAEVDRLASSDLGFNLLDTGGLNQFGSVTTGQYGQLAGKQIDALKRFPTQRGDFRTITDTTRVGDILNVFAWRPDVNLGAMIKALQGRGLLQILAEPNLITMNGKEASFMAGGEFPYAVVSSGGQASIPIITVQFKEFGVRLKFTPNITPTGLINLKIAPEVSELDFQNSVNLLGFTIPALRTRRAQTEIELKDGQSFAIAGLIDNRVIEQYSKIYGLGDIPVLGNLFKSKSLKKTNNELLVLITPKVVKPRETNEFPPLPERDLPYLRENSFEGKMGHQDQKKP